jgi:hypothetical protein
MHGARGRRELERRSAYQAGAAALTLFRARHTSSTSTSDATDGSPSRAGPVLPPARDRAEVAVTPTTRRRRPSVASMGAPARCSRSLTPCCPRHGRRSIRPRSRPCPDHYARISERPHSPLKAEASSSSGPLRERASRSSTRSRQRCQRATTSSLRERRRAAISAPTMLLQRRNACTSPRSSDRSCQLAKHEVPLFWLDACRSDLHKWSQLRLTATAIRTPPCGSVNQTAQANSGRDWNGQQLGGRGLTSRGAILEMLVIEKHRPRRQPSRRQPPRKQRPRKQRPRRQPPRRD